MNRLEPDQDPFEAIVAARTAAAAFEAKAVALADDVNVGQMSDTPGALAGGRRIEESQIDRLIHARVRYAPDQRRNREVGRDQDDGVGHGGTGEPMPQREIRRVSDPARRGPGQRCDPGGPDAQQDSGPDRTRGAQTPTRGGGRLPAEEALHEMTYGFAAKRVGRLNGQGIERPEIRFGGPQQRPPADPSQSGDCDEEQRGPQTRLPDELDRGRGQPGRGHQRRQSKKDARHQDRSHPGEQQLGQADFGEQAPGDGKKRPLLRAGGIVLRVAPARIEERGSRRAISPHLRAFSA